MCERARIFLRLFALLILGLHKHTRAQTHTHSPLSLSPTHTPTHTHIRSRPAACFHHQATAITFCSQMFIDVHRCSSAIHDHRVIMQGGHTDNLPRHTTHCHLQHLHPVIVCLLPHTPPKSLPSCTHFHPTPRLMNRALLLPQGT